LSGKAGRVSLVGAGPGDPGLLTLRAAHLLRTAQVLLYDALATDAIVALAPETCERIFVGKRGGNHAMPQHEIEALAVAKARDGKHVVRLKGGDPFVFGRGGEEAQTLAAAGVAFEIAPGISSALAAPAYAGIPVTHRDYNTAFTVATGHEDPLKNASTLDFAKLADPHRTTIFLMAMGNLDAICSQLLANGMPEATPVAVISDGTRPTQRTVTGTLITIGDAVRREGIGAPAIVVVGSVVATREQIRWFDTAPLFGKRILVTRPVSGARGFAAAVRARGAEPILAPTISIEPPDDEASAHATLDRLDSFAWVVFSSRNAVDAVFAHLDATGGDARSFGRARVAAIGPRTAGLLRERGIRADLIPNAYVSEELTSALIAATQPSDAVAILRAQDGRDVLQQTLADAGRIITSVPLYRTVSVRDARFARDVERAEILTFLSASAMRGYIENFADANVAVQAARGKVVACIGPVVADAAREVGLHVDVQPDGYTGDEMLDALEEFFASRG
jgi:uroporphyrinogen III methyltransferase/synthase